MADKEIIIKVSADTKDAAAGVDQLKTKLDGVNNTPLDKTFKNFKQEIKDSTAEFLKLEKEFGTFSEQAKAANQRTAALKDEFKQLSAQVNNFQPTNKLQSLVDISSSATTSIADLKGKIGSIVPGFAAAESGAASFSNTLKLLALNPFVLILTSIVVVLKTIYEAFQSSVEGGKKIQQVWAGISAVAAQMKDAIFGLVRSFADVAVAAYKFITLDFKGAGEAMKKANQESAESMRQLGNAVTTTLGKYMELERQQQINDKARKNAVVAQSETEKLLVKSRETLTDETASIKEKTKALEEVTKADKASAAERVRIAAEDLRIASERVKGIGGEAAKKGIQELRDLTVALNDAERENAIEGIKLNKQKRMLDKQADAEDKAAADEKKAQADKIAEANKKAAADAKKVRDEIDKAIDETYKHSLSKQGLELYNLQQKFDTELAMYKKYGLDSLLLQKNYADDTSAIIAKNLTNEVENVQAASTTKTQINSDFLAGIKANHADELRDHNAALDAQREWSQITTDDKVKMASDALGQVSDILGKQTVAGKAFAIAQTTIDTYQSATSAYKSMAGIPIVGPALGVVAAAAAVAAGVANVKKILAVKVPGKASGGSVSAGSTITAPTLSAPQINSTMLNPNTAKVQDVRVTNQPDTPLRAYIVDKDLQTNQNKQKFLSDLGTF